MRLTPSIRAEIDTLSKRLGGRRALARALGVSAPRPGEWIDGPAESVSDAIAERLTSLLHAHDIGKKVSSWQSGLEDREWKLVAWFRSVGEPAKRRILRMTEIAAQREAMKHEGE